ncbi:DUF408 domain protein [Metarhizium album ARSEF 1941]|uniref:RNA polymerase II subunit B1 CTD phosphatase RPAP2 homolog n=1 Tax=Metarhizium album (strain ARSEF 1941) TaxID=1081103 RepID=A0A0B2WUS3_METAS|nr:DUF408 domain protein [Metarhizium album ARSEF 1941]KHN99796.1 DUF408 domain protein [Metarhizium album ARSEF 1941]
MIRLPSGGRNSPVLQDLRTLRPTADGAPSCECKMDHIEQKQRQLKGILKNSTSEAGTAARSESEAREIAIAHARLLQHRKELEAEILDSLVLLSEYPLVRTTPYSAANPAESDVSGFKTHVRLFQPSDYDDLIEERNVNEQCGYALCGRPRRKVGPGGEWKLTGGGDIVKRRDLEKWCCPTCAKRALFVKVQLNETAAWERAGIPDIQIDLLNEDESAETDADRTARRLGRLKLEEQRQAARDAKTLALERGERGIGESADKIKVELTEKETRAPKTANPSTQSADDHLRIEGHRFDLPSRPRAQN